MPTSQKRNTLSKSKLFAFGLKPIELRCKSGRVLIRKWAVYDTQTAHLFYVFQHCIIDADGDRHAERSIDVTKRSILLLP